MKRLLIVYHSRTGGAAQMANAAAQGARTQQGAEVRVVQAADAAAADVESADGYIFAAPENLASLSGAMKEFFDRTYYSVLERISGRPYALMICAGSDGTGAARQVARIATGWRLKPIADPLIVNTSAQTPEEILAPKLLGADALVRCSELGAAMAAGMSMGVF